MKKQTFSSNILVLFLPSFVVGMTVLTTGKSLSENHPIQRMVELQNSSILDLLEHDPGEITLCARFVVYQFVDWSLEQTHTSHFAHVFMKSGPFYFLVAMTMNGNTEPYFKENIANWVNGNNCLIGILPQLRDLNATNIKPGNWNHICIKISINKKLYQVFLNGKMIYKILQRGTKDVHSLASGEI